MNFFWQEFYHNLSFVTPYVFSLQFDFSTIWFVFLLKKWLKINNHVMHLWVQLGIQTSSIISALYSWFTTKLRPINNPCNILHVPGQSSFWIGETREGFHWSDQGRLTLVRPGKAAIGMNREGCHWSDQGRLPLVRPGKADIGQTREGYHWSDQGRLPLVRPRKAASSNPCFLLSHSIKFAVTHKPLNWQLTPVPSVMQS